MSKSELASAMQSTVQRLQTSLHDLEEKWHLAETTPLTKDGSNLQPEARVNSGDNNDV